MPPTEGTENLEDGDGDMDFLDDVEEVLGKQEVEDGSR